MAQLEWQQQQQLARYARRLVTQDFLSGDGGSPFATAVRMAAKETPAQRAQADADAMSFPLTTPTRKAWLYTYGTLDDVPEAYTRSLEQLEQVTTSRLVGFEGVVIYGPATLAWPHDGYWGRPVELPSKEKLQMRFEPSNLPQVDIERVDRALVSTRLMRPGGRMMVRTAILFRSGCTALAPGLDMMRQSGGDRKERPVAVRGLHFLLAGLFPRHHPELGARDPVVQGNSPLQHDARGFEALRSNSYSIYERVRAANRSRGQLNPLGAAAGPSIVAVANELVDRHWTPPESMRATEPISRKDLLAQQARAERELVAAAGEQGATFALNSAATLLEHLSAEGLLGAAAHPFFDGALPDKLIGPHGVSLALAVAMRLAINWEKYKLPAPSKTDVQANDHVRMIWHSQGPTHLPMLKHQWAIDLVVDAAVALAEQDIADNHRREGLSRDTALPQAEDNKLWLQRVGQRLITSTFGLGSINTVAQPNVAGTPWRTYDVETKERDVALKQAGCKFEGVTEDSAVLSTVGARRTAVIQMAVGVETWLRRGRYRKMQITPMNDTRDVDEQIDRLSNLLGKLMLPQIVQALADAATGNPTKDSLVPQKAYAKVLEPHLNILALDNAIYDVRTVLMIGPSFYLTHDIGSYVVAPSQTSPCCECEAPVHVLQATLLDNKLSSCTACHARRCQTCAGAHTASIDRAYKQMHERGHEGPLAVGSRCKACGAEPQEVRIAYEPGRDGTTVAHFEMTERRPPGQPEKVFKVLCEFTHSKRGA